MFNLTAASSALCNLKIKKSPQSDNCFDWILILSRLQSMHTELHLSLGLSEATITVFPWIMSPFDCQFSQHACTNFMQIYLYLLISTRFFILTSNLHWIMSPFLKKPSLKSLMECIKQNEVKQCWMMASLMSHQVEIGNCTTFVIKMYTYYLPCE